MAACRPELAAQCPGTDRAKNHLEVLKHMMEWLSDAWTATAGFFSGIPWEILGVWSLTITLLVVGFIGAIIPFLDFSGALPKIAGRPPWSLSLP